MIDLVKWLNQNPIEQNYFIRDKFLLFKIIRTYCYEPYDTVRIDDSIVKILYRGNISIEKY